MRRYVAHLIHPLWQFDAFFLNIWEKHHWWLIIIASCNKINNKCFCSNFQPENIISAAVLADISLLDTPPSAAMLNPGEIIRTSGKFMKPTKIPGKNYSKDEVIIRNADSGKGNSRTSIGNIIQRVDDSQCEFHTERVVLL